LIYLLIRIYNFWYIAFLSPNMNGCWIRSVIKIFRAIYI
jgi:hypothetical protein